MVKSRVFLGMGDLPPFNRNPYNGYINPYYWVDDHPLLYGNNGSLDPGTYIGISVQTANMQKNRRGNTTFPAIFSGNPHRLRFGKPPKNEWL